MSIFDNLMGRAQAPAPAPAPATTPAAQAPEQPPATTPTLPAAIPTDPAALAASVANLWDTTADPAAPAPFSLGVTTEGLQQLAQSIDVTASIPAELKAAIAAGGQGALDAMIQLQNHTAQQMFARNAAVSNALVEQAVKKMQEGANEAIDRRIKSLNVADTTFANNPALKDPLVAPIVASLQQRAIQKYPQATSAEINALVNAGLAQLGNALNPAPVAAAKTNGNEEQDWLTWLGA